MNSDKDVMEHFPHLLTEPESDSLFEKICLKIKENQYGLWAVESKKENELIGFIGFNDVSFPSEFSPCIEIGWRFKKEYWGKGYATEGANRCLLYGFSSLGFEEVVSFTSVRNLKSENVMKKIGMIKIGEFQHPYVADNSPLKRHLLYKITKIRYENFINKSINSK
jgi:[ribosomal protein S5]-alanine N-acetyltransferase